MFLMVSGGASVDWCTVAVVLGALAGGGALAACVPLGRAVLRRRRA